MRISTAVVVSPAMIARDLVSTGERSSERGGVMLEILGGDAIFV